MNHLIQITQTEINGIEINSVNAKELHEALGLKNKFANWIKKQKEILDDYEEGQDYIRTTKSGDSDVIVKSGLNLQGKECEYILSLDMAKHISLMSKSKKGKEVRQYFIDTEKQNTQPTLIMADVLKSLQLAAQGLKQQDERLDSHHYRLSAAEQYIKDEIKTRPIDHNQQTALLNARHRKVHELLESYGEDKSDKELKRKIYAKVGSMFKKQFNLPRYDSLPKSQFNDGIGYINNLTLASIA